MKKIITILLLCFIMAGLTGCMGNSGNLTEGMTNATNTFHYVLTVEVGEYHLHEVDRWKDGTSDALGITTKCCNNQFWTSYNTAVLYTNKPKYLPNDVIICKRED